MVNPNSEERRKFAKYFERRKKYLGRRNFCAIVEGFADRGEASEIRFKSGLDGH